MAQPLKVALLQPSFVPDRDNQQVWGDISASEIAAGGPYVAGGKLLTTKSTNYDPSSDRTNLLADDTVWGPGFTADSAFAVIYDSATNRLWSLVDFEGTKEIVSGTLTIDWSATALLYTIAV
jgi:hypothetical protein